MSDHGVGFMCETLQNIGWNFPPESLFLSIWKDVKKLLKFLYGHVYPKTAGGQQQMYVLCNLGYAKVRQWRENSKQGTFLNSSFCLRPDSFMYLTTTTTNGGTKGLEAGAAPRSWGWALRTNYITLVMGSPLHWIGFSAPDEDICVYMLKIDNVMCLIRFLDILCYRILTSFFRVQ